MRTVFLVMRTSVFVMRRARRVALPVIVAMRAENLLMRTWIAVMRP